MNYYTIYVLPYKSYCSLFELRAELFFRTYNMILDGSIKLLKLLVNLFRDYCSFNYVYKSRKIIRKDYNIIIYASTYVVYISNSRLNYLLGVQKSSELFL